MSKNLLPADFPAQIKALEQRIKVLERASSIGNASCQAAQTQWQDTTGTAQISIGLQPNGSYEIHVGSTIVINATGFYYNGVKVTVP